MAVYQPTYRDKTTGELKTSATWWYEFTYNGERIRESAKTTRKTIAVEAEKQRRLALEQVNAGIPVESLKTRIKTVRRALAAYKETYPADHHREKGIRLVKDRSVPLERLLGALLPQDLTEDRIKRYMLARKQEGAGNRTINIELAVLSRAIGNKFSIMWPKLKRLEENHEVGRALKPEEEQRIVEAAVRNRSRLVGPIVRLALITGMRHDEIRLLRWNQIDFEKKHITVGKSKTAAGQGRVIPMGPMLEAIVSGYASWYASIFGPLEPGWYAFPRSIGPKPVDPTVPLTSFKVAWDVVRKAAGVKCRFHDLRHTVCTKMAETGVPESTMLAIMGHMSRKMLERYSHVRQAAKREAMSGVEARSAFPVLVEVPKESPTVSGLAKAKATSTH